jgi:membrane protease YdiL (CAAX protease family)
VDLDEVNPDSEAPASASQSLERVPAATLTWSRFIKRVLIIWSVGIGIPVVAFVALAVYLVIQGIDPEPYGDEPFVIWPLVVCSGVSAATLGWYFACVRGQLPISEGLALRPVRSRVILGSMAIGIVGAFVVSIVTTYFEVPDSEMANQVRRAMGPTDRPHPPYVIYVAVLLAPFYEEVYYRGFLYTCLRSLAPAYVAILATSVWFASNHALQLAGDWYVLVGVALIGVCFTSLRARYGSTFPSISCHLAYNATTIGISLYRFFF